MERFFLTFIFESVIGENLARIQIAYAEGRFPLVTHAEWLNSLAAGRLDVLPGKVTRSRTGKSPVQNTRCVFDLLPFCM